jgi:hypothetical protein
MNPSSTTVKCVHCGFETESTAERCANPSCGRSDWNPPPTTKCPECGFMNDADAKNCFAGACRAFLKSDAECLRSIDVSLRKIRRIAVWFLILSLLGLLLGLMAATGAFRVL